MPSETLRFNLTLPPVPEFWAHVGDCTMRIGLFQIIHVWCPVNTSPLQNWHSPTFILCHPKIQVRFSSRAWEEKQGSGKSEHNTNLQETTFLTSLSIPSPCVISLIKQQQFITSLSEEFYSSCWRTQINKLLFLLQSNERLLVELVWGFYHSLPDPAAKLGILLSPMEPKSTMSSSKGNLSWQT